MNTQANISMRRIAIVMLITFAFALAFALSGCAEKKAENVVTIQATSEEDVQPESEAPSTIIDLSNPDELHKVNLFLSNFSEKGPDFSGYSFDSPSNKQLSFYAIKHVALNDPADYHQADPGEWGDVHSGLAYYVPVDVLVHYDDVFLKQGVSAANFSDDYIVRDSCVYFYPSDMDMEADGVAFATKAVDVGDGRVKVDFEVYGSNYEVTDESLYNMSLDELKNRFGASSPRYSGSAVIEPMEDGSMAPFKLWSFEMA